MQDITSLLKPWVLFAGSMLVIAVLYWAQALFVPIALAVLLSFLLAPPVTALQHWLGRIPAVLLIAIFVFGLLGLAGWGAARQLNYLAYDLPDYRDNIRQKIADVRGASKGGAVEQLQKTIEEIRSEIAQEGSRRGKSTKPVVVTSERIADPWGGFLSWLDPLLAPLATAGLVIILAIFMLLERSTLRDHLIQLFGYGRLAVTTKAFDEATTRVSRYLLRQSLVNLAYGLGVGIGLYLIGVPHWLLWACLAAILRFIPYIGPWLAASAPILVSLAALPGWSHPLLVIGLFLGLELVTNLVLEPFLYAGAAGVSQVSLLLAVAFWTWLWGPMGLLMATPLTVCFVVLGKHVPGLQSIAALMSDDSGLDPQYVYYQRLLARDPGEASDLIERHVKTNSPETVYDEILLPALNYAERDRIEERLSTKEESAVIRLSAELLADAAVSMRKAVRRTEPESETSALKSVSILGCAANERTDELALRMLEQLLADTPVHIDFTATGMLASDIAELIRQNGYGIVCIADLPPSAPLRTRYLVKKLKAMMPDLKIAVGRWAPPLIADEDHQPLLVAGADHVASTLLETRSYLCTLAKAAPATALSSTLRERVIASIEIDG